MSVPRIRRLGLALSLVLLCALSGANNSVHTSYLWHLHQPIYWPDQRRVGGDDQYESAWGSIQQTDGGAAHPENNLRDIFGKDDRVAAYQSRTRDSIGTILGHPDGGAQINYSGALMENVGGLGAAGQLGYSGGWSGPINEARSWTTSGGFPRADVVNFAYHHALLPLHSERTQWLQIRLHQELMERNWGIAPGTAPGFFPAEMCFTPRMIPVLRDLGVEWSVVSNTHLSRACPDFPLVLGSGGVNCDPPNLADQINPAQGEENYWRQSISRGCSPTNAFPFAHVPHRAQHIDPDTGAAETIVVVPSDQAISWEDGFGQIGAGIMDTIAAGNDAARPMLVLLTHDGDNAWGGGFSYYMEAVQNFVNDAAGRGYSPSTVRQYLADHPVPADDIVHVEDGGWVNADSDFGSPIFINWLYPLLDANGQSDPIDGWHEKAREYAIFTAAENRIRTAEDLAGGPATTRIEHVLDPGAATSAVERAWHYYLSSMDSGNVYFGAVLDMEVKGGVGCNEAFEHVDPILAAMLPSEDTTEPTVFTPQRHPHNPGAVSFGVQYGYQQFINDGSFTVWTFAHDVSGVQSATLHYRVDVDGGNPLDSTQNETYAGGAEVGAWQSLAMTSRPYPAENIYNKPEIDFFEQPAHIADHFSATVPANTESLIDYYVEVTDARGNVARTDIQHVWVGDGSGATGGGRVSTDPSPLLQGQSATISYDASAGPIAGAAQVFIHHGFDNWAAGTVSDPDPAMTFNAAADLWEFTLPMPADRTQFDCAFNDGQGNWDNNSGQDCHFSISVPTAATGNALLSPNPARAGEPATLIYEVSDGPLSAEAAIFAHLEYNGGATVISPNPAMAFDTGELRWELDLTPPTDARSLTTSFNSGAGRVDDRNGTDWTFMVLPPPTGTPTLTPNPPLANADVFIAYDPGDGPLTTATAVSVTVGFLFLPPGPADPLVDHAMTFNAAAGRWEATVGVHIDAQQMTLSFNDGATVDDNNGEGWIFDVTPVGQTEVVTVIPNPPVAAEQVHIRYFPVGRPLESATQVYAHIGWNGWSTIVSPDPAMTFAFGAGAWDLDMEIPANATELNLAFNDGAGTWDNNDTQDWNFPVTGTTPTDPIISLSRSSISAAGAVGEDAPSQIFTVTNNGTGSLNYAVSIVFTDGSGPITSLDVRDHLLRRSASGADMDLNGDGVVNVADLVWVVINPPTGWLTVSPTEGASAGEADILVAMFDSDALSEGTYAARIDVAGNAFNSPQSIDVMLTVGDSIPQETTVVPNPPTAGQAARVWYHAGGGPIAGAAQVVLHWGINGGAMGGGNWEDVTDTAMTESATAGIWFADITLPVNATSLNFVTNNGMDVWDNNGGQDWNFAVESSAAGLR